MQEAARIEPGFAAVFPGGDAKLIARAGGAGGGDEPQRSGCTCTEPAAIDRKRLTELTQRQAQLNQLIRSLEGAWMEAAARLEALAATQQGVD